MEVAFKHDLLVTTWFSRAGRSLAAITTVLWMGLAFSAMPGPAQVGVDTATASGDIQGQVLITRKLTSQRMRFRLYPGFKPLPPPTAIENVADERRNVVIYLKSTPSITATQVGGEVPRIAQVGETFVPHVLPIVKGTTVDFPNKDPIFHNVFSLSGTKSFDLGRYPQGDSRSVAFDRSGIVPVFCHLHSNMSAIIVVLDNKFFAVADAEGHYRIEDIPAGTYTLVGWHERSERVERQVEVLSGQSVELNVTIPIEDEQATGQ
jgi:plastocyanin